MNNKSSAVGILIFIVFLIIITLFSSVMLWAKTTILSSNSTQRLLNVTYNDTSGSSHNILTDAADYSFFRLIDNYIYLWLGLFVVISSIINYYAAKNPLAFIISIAIIIFATQLCVNLKEIITSMPSVITDQVNFFSNHMLIYNNLPVIVLGIWIIDFVVFGVFL